MKSFKGANILILGVSYKKDISDVRESPALDIIKLLDDQGAKITYNDPHVPELKDHSCYDYDFIVRESNLVVDTRNATKGVKTGRGKITKL